MSSSIPTTPVAQLASELLDRLDELVDELARRIDAEIDVYARGGVVSASDLRQSLLDNIRRILTHLRQPGSIDLEVPQRIGRLRASQDVPLPEVLRAYRFGFTVVWEWLLDGSRAAGAAAVDSLLETSTSIWDLADAYSMAMTDAYRSVMSERMVAADRRRSGLVSAIFDGSVRHSAWEVAKALELPYDGQFLVLAVESNDEPLGAAGGLNASLRVLDVASAWRSHLDYEVGLLSLGRRRDPGPVLDQINRHAVTRVGISPVFARLDGASRAARLAQVAMDSLPSGTSGVRQFEDEALLDLLIKDRDTTRAYVRRVLGRVLALPGDDRATLLATASAWLDANGSAADAGKALYCHENTVRHRLRRLEEHLGGLLEDPRQLSDLRTALQAIRAFPEFADPGGDQ